MMLGFTTTERIDIALAVTSGGVALATGVLAWKTRNMAKETARMAQATETEAEKVADQVAATRKQVRISSAALRVSTRPWLTKGTERDPAAVVQLMSAQDIAVQIRVRNVGPGLAVILPEGCEVRGGGKQPGTKLTRRGYAGTPVLPPNDETWVSFRVQGSDVEADYFLGKTESFGQITVSVLYFDADLGGGKRADFRIAATDAGGSEWIFNEVDYVTPIEGKPGEIIDEELDVTVKFRPSD
jgi:hypothetical protein